MITRIQKWGNSQGVRFPKELLQQVHVAVGDEVDIIVFENEIIVKPTQKIRGKYKLSELLPKNTANAKEVDWGQPAGKETW